MTRLLRKAPRPPLQIITAAGRMICTMLQKRFDDCRVSSAGGLVEGRPPTPTIGVWIGSSAQEESDRSLVTSGHRLVDWQMALVRARREIWPGLEKRT
jgi:hypothetical protein